MYDKLVIKVNTIDIKIASTGELVTKTQYKSDTQCIEKKIEHVDKKTYDNITITDIENEISSITGLVTTAAFNTKLTKIANKLPSITNVATKVDVNTKATYLESKIPNITNLATKAALNRKATYIENKIPDTNHLTKKLLLIQTLQKKTLNGIIF